jgi:hypothetical protein
MERARLLFLGIDTRPLNEESPDGLCIYAENVRPYGPEKQPYWRPFEKFKSLTIDKEPPVIPTVPCDESVASGGAGTTILDIALTSSGGVICFSCQAFGVPDKFEILHNGVKKATSGMTVNNEGPFDATNNSSADQYIGTSKGSIPTRNAVFTAQTGLVISAGTDRQLVWWTYTSSDYLQNTLAQLVINGPSGTAWNVTRRCEEDPTP